MLYHCERVRPKKRNVFLYIYVMEEEYWITKIKI